MTGSRPLGVGVIGLGFMGRTHVAAYRAADAAGFANRLVAVCDPHADRRSGRAISAGNLDSGAAREQLFDPREVFSAERFEQLLELDDVELVSICTPTDTHVDLALRALERGKHVLVEKPVALRSAEVERLAAAAAASPTRCMPGLCIRFWPAYAWLLGALREQRFGPVRSATFTRLAPRPDWSPHFYLDPARSGGALVDLHAHDADFVQACFGPPGAVSSTGTLDHVTTLYHYDEGPAHVVAEGGWDLAAGAQFRMRFLIVCEGATIDFDLGRAPELLLVRDGTQEPIELESTTGYDLEIRHLLTAIANNTPPAVTLPDALSLAHLLEAEQASLKFKRRVDLP